MKLFKGDWTVLFYGPICITIWILVFSGFVAPVFIGSMLRKRIKRKVDIDSTDQVAEA
jgi:hypothetical protein